MTKKLNKEDFAICNKYGMEFMAARADYLRTPGREGVREIKRVYEHIYGKEFVGSDACGYCELRLLRSVMDSYFYTKELNDKAAAKKAAEKKSKE